MCCTFVKYMHYVQLQILILKGEVFSNDILYCTEPDVREREVSNRGGDFD